MNKMIVANLAYRPVRSIISIIAVAVEVTLILLIVGLALGLLNDSKQRTQGIGADVMVRPPGTSILTAFSGAPMPMAIADLLRKQPHVVVVSPVVASITSSNTLEAINGIDLDSFEKLGGPLQYIHGGPFQGPDSVIVDDYYANSNKVRVGSTVDTLNHKFTVTGIVLHGRGARRYIPITIMQDLIGAPNKASIFYVKVDDPKNAGAVAEQLKTVLEGYNIVSTEEFLSLMSADRIPGLSIFINIVIGISVVVGFIVIFQSMYTAVMERTREIGILKSLGASKLYVMRIILRETLVLAIAGIIFGIVVSIVARAGIRGKWPTLPVQITGPWIFYAAVIAVVGALFGAIYPAFKAAQKDPIDALAYE
ncbi:MAG TPA: FtsX-like permease family protein [Candidatus Angelobacter sp.]|jgi:putative ABC transport system permease protein|nr:FtsX-like permease family protein [Candidatus Angelobacter sp.]